LVAFADKPDYQGVWLWDIAADRTRYFGEHKFDLNRLQFFGNGKRLLAWTPTGETTCWDVPKGKMLWTDTFGNIPVGSGDGRLVMGARRQANFQSAFVMLDADTGTPAKGVVAPSFQQSFYLPGAVSDDGR